MDGLLLDSERCVWSEAQREEAKNFGFKMTESFIKRVLGSNHRRYVELFHEEFGDVVDGDLFMEKISEYYSNYCKTKAIPLKTGVIEMLEFLKKNNILISLGSSTQRELVEIALEKSGILHYFDFLVCGDEVKQGKPHPEIFLKSVEHFNLTADECIVFEDSQNGAKAAYEGNIKLILVPDVKEPSSLDKEKAFAIIDSLQKAIPIIKEINNIN